ncbi:hypothetical protein FACS1894179_06800 [Bacteroidia bacterium]|nr:hypothetical protein FACS1894179_06800 [Bacteroidia bacterium]
MTTTNKVHCIIYRLRKRGYKINTRNRTIFFEYQNDEQLANMADRCVLRLCREFGFVRQAAII